MNLKELYTNVQTQLDQQLPFVVYRKPGEDKVNTVLQHTNVSHKITTYDQAGFVFAPFDSAKDAILIPDSESRRYQAVILNNTSDNELVQDHKKVIDRVEETITISKNTHVDLVKKGIKAIKNEAFKKVVLSRKEEVPFSKKKILTVFKQLISGYPSAFVYCWYHPGIGIWLGATPEVLVKIKGEEFTTMALAGTQPHIDSMNASWGTKEIEEQAMVTNYVLEELSTVITDIKHSKTYTHRAGTLLHLRTDIIGTLYHGKSTINDIISALHPTPAVCGVPKKEATSFILENEGYDRTYYTGFLGELNWDQEGKVESNLFVNLRCMEIKNDHAILYVGGGITKDSDPDKEWEETVRKTATMKKVL